MNNPLWGIDLGGTKIEGVILPSLNDSSPILRTRIDTGSEKDYEHILNQVEKAREYNEGAIGHYSPQDRFWHSWGARSLV